MITVKIDLPEELLTAADVPPRRASAELLQIVVLYLYARDKISLANAAEWLGISQWEFFELNKKWGMPIHYGLDDYQEDLATLETISK